jgi:hypothetical protein
MPGQVAETPERRGHDRQRDALVVVIEFHIGKRLVRLHNDTKKEVIRLPNLVHARGDAIPPIHF